MAVNVEILKCPDIFQNRREVFPIPFIVRAAFKESGIVGVLSVTDMGRTDNKIKIVAFGIDCQSPFQMGLQAKLHAEEKFDLPGIFFFVLNKIIEIRVCVQLKNSLVLRIGIDIIHIHVLCKAHAGKP